ncbi:uncharacterized protein LOC112052639 [Bicyclus anynana]|uniref:Uncharacterized protein LOC112052639 n=1 Tax=Bicyclus anynana TaxID=110368 RepID=A0A6J1NIL4_BICAN|nr:uncharacterized protein LOC112052639 [Bicyclus anynana]
MDKETEMFEEDEYVDVRTLPLKPPLPAPPQEKCVRRVWHPVMWDNANADAPLVDNSEEQKAAERASGREYPHKQRIRNLKRLIAEGKVKPSSETVIFFLCNKFAISEERQSKLS